jgi:DNA-binding transcriptional ArsR family regulator
MAKKLTKQVLVNGVDSNKLERQAVRRALAALADAKMWAGHARSGKGRAYEQLYWKLADTLTV